MAEADGRDAPWRRDHVGPDPAPPEPIVGSTTGWPAPTPDDVPDPWSRDAARRASLGDPVAPPDDDLLPATIETADATGSTGSLGARVGRSGRTIAFVVIALVVVLLVAWWPSSYRIERPDPFLRLPAEPAELWSAERDRTIQEVVVTDDAVIVAGSGRIAAFDPADGDEQWAVDAPITRTVILSGPTDGAVVMFDLEHEHAMAFDVATGEALWERGLSERRAVFGGPLSVIEFGRGAGGARDVMLIDARTGRPSTDRYSIAGWFADGRYLPVLVGSTIRMLDTERATLTGPEIDAEAVWPLVSATIADGRVLAAGADGTVVSFDQSGDVVDRLDVDGFGGRGAFELIGIGTHDAADVIVAGSDESSGLRVSEGRLELAWSRSGRLQVAGRTGAGPVALFRDDDRLSIVDALTGRARADLADLGTGARVEFELGGDGVLVRRDEVLVALGLDGRERWRIDAGLERHVAGSGLIVTFNDRRITVYG